MRKKSETLQTVVQGSSVSCVLFLIFILDLPQIFHKERHTLQQQVNCIQPNAKTFIDDMGIVITKTKEDDETETETEISYGQNRKIYSS